MTELLQSFYAGAIALLMSGVGVDTMSNGNAVALIQDGEIANVVRIESGCLGLHSIGMIITAGVMMATVFRRPYIAAISLVVAPACSFARCLTLIILSFYWPSAFETLHAQCGHATYIAGVAILSVFVFARQRIEKAQSNIK